MSIAIQPFFEPTGLNSGPSVALYTAGAVSRIDSMTVVNATNAAATFNLYLVPAGRMANASNQMIINRPIQPGESWVVDPVLGHMLEQGDAIYATSSTPNSLVLFAAGLVIS